MSRPMIFTAMGAAVLVLILLMLYPEFVFSPPDTQQGFEVEVLLTGLDTPWAIDFLPDDIMIFTERGGRVSIFKNGQRHTIGNIPVSEESESGLLGVAVDPDFEETREIYFYYTTEDSNRISKFTLTDKLETGEVILDGIPSSRWHDGGRIKFGPDGLLYATTGDASLQADAQFTTSLAGKILRMHKNGSVPIDNRFKNQVYSYGHRNPQGLAWDPDTGELYASEHGSTGNDEINLIQNGANYGWAIVQCDESVEGYNDAVRCFSEFTLAPAGMDFYNGDLYVGGLRGAQLRRLEIENGKVVDEEELFDNLGRIREVVTHGDWLYIATSNFDGRGVPRKDDDKIIRIRK